MDQTKKKQLETLLYSTVGIAAMALLLIAFNLIAAKGRQRIDLTAENAYTLSPGTRAILAKLDTPVQIRFYCTKNVSAMPVFLTTYAQRVEDLLGEYRQASKGRIEIQRLNPEPDSDAEDSARLDGVEGQQLRTGEKIYLGLSIALLDQKQAISFLTPDRERLLEYDISRAIARVMTAEKPVIGVMSPLPVMGQMNPMAMQMRQPQRSQPWAFMSELARDFNVKQVEVTADKIPDDIKVLVVIHPKAVTDDTQYLLDQFVLRGGKLIAFVDPLCALDRPPVVAQGQMPPMSSSSLDKLFKAWGLTFETGKVVADMEHVAKLQEGPNPTVLALNETAINKDDVVTANADNLLMAFTGTFSGTPADGLAKTVLIKSSKHSQLVEALMASLAAGQIASNLTPSGTEYPLAIRLAGRFKTAFPDGKPKPAASPSEPKPEEKPAAPGLKESSEPSTVVLIGDADMIQDPVAVREIQAIGQRLIMPLNSNLSFAQSVVEQLAGDSNLIAVRSRASRERPFTVVQKMQADAEASYRTKIKELETSLAETQRTLNELQKSKGEAGQRFILSPEQQQELVNFRKKEADVKVQLKQMRKHLRSEIDSLENRITWLNIAGMPLAVILAGFGFAAMKRKRVGK
ncbi:MAG TPA: GldG family protein [Chthoniobacterales bacterium]|nr:GldG family protein [Chthoniobacterales bacterium]